MIMKYIKALDNISLLAFIIGHVVICGVAIELNEPVLGIIWNLFLFAAAIFVGRLAYKYK